MVNKFKKSVQIFVGVIIVVAVAMTVLGFSGFQIDKVINWIIPIGISFILSAFIGTIIEAYGGDGLKNVTLTIPIGKFHFSISLFTLLTILLKWWWF